MTVESDKSPAQWPIAGSRDIQGTAKEPPSTTFRCACGLHERMMWPCHIGQRRDELVSSPMAVRLANITPRKRGCNPRPDRLASVALVMPAIHFHCTGRNRLVYMPSFSQVPRHCKSVARRGEPSPGSDCPRPYDINGSVDK